MESKHRQRSRELLAATDERPAGRFIFVLLCAIPIVATIAFGAVDVWALGILCVLTTVLFCGWLVASLRSRGFTVSTNPIQLPMLGLLAIGVIQLIPLWNSGIPTDLLAGAGRATLSLDPYATRLFLARLITQIVFFAAALTFIVSRERKKTLAILLVTFGGLIAFFGILQRLTNPESIYGMRPTPQAIPFGPFVNQHHFAALMEMLSGLALGMLFGRASGRDQKLLLAFAAIIMAVAVLFTGSRGGLISYLGVLMFAAIASFAAERAAADAAAVKHRVLIFAGSIGLFVIAVGSVLFLGGGEGFLRGIGGGDPATDITSGRGHFWTVALKIFRDHPIIGSGFDAFAVAFSRYDTWKGIYRVEQAHNDYLQTLSDSGLLGLVCVVVFIVLLLREGVHAIADQSDSLKRSISLGALAGCIGILIHSFFDFPLRTPSNSFIFLLLVVLMLASKKHRTRKRRASEQ
jgi:O-antigen ligase